MNTSLRYSSASFLVVAVLIALTVPLTGPRLFILLAAIAVAGVTHIATYIPEEKP